MASPEQGESAAGSPHSTPVPEEMDFDLFGRQGLPRSVFLIVEGLKNAWLEFTQSCS